MIPDTPIFELWERETLETNLYVHPYTGITKKRKQGLKNPPLSRRPVARRRSPGLVRVHPRLSTSSFPV